MPWLHSYLGFSFTVWFRHILSYQNKSVQPFTPLYSRNIDLCLMKCSSLFSLVKRLYKWSRQLTRIYKTREYQEMTVEAYVKFQQSLEAQAQLGRLVV